MATYKTKDGAIFTAVSDADFVTQLRKSSKFDSHLTDAEYMKNYAERVRLYSGNDINCGTPEAFVKDCISTELLTLG